MKLWITTLGTVLLVCGCQEETAPPAKSAVTDAKPAAMVMMTEGCPDKDATHVVTEDTPVFTSMPGQGINPVGMLKSGTKVLAMVPGPVYTKCVMGGGKSVYIKTTSLKPTTN